MFLNVKKSGICGVDREDRTNYLRRVWFFTFMAKNYKNVGCKDLAEIVKIVKGKEVECGYFDYSRRTYIPNILKNIYSNDESISFDLRNEVWAYISKRYLADLENIFSEAKETLLSTKKDTYDNWFKIFTLVPFENIPLVIPEKKPASIVKTTSDSSSKDENKKPNSVSSQKNDSEPKLTSLMQDGKSCSEPRNAATDEKISKEAKTDTVETLPAKDQPIEVAAKQENDSKSASDAQPGTVSEAEVEADTLKEEEIRKLVLHTEMQSRESVPQAFEESLNTLFDLSQHISESYKLEGIELLIKTLNSTAYGNLLDKVYFAIQDKSKEPSDFGSVSILIKNALQEHGFAFECYSKEPVGTCIGAPSDDDMEYISRNYRWKSDKILYHNLYVCAPGMMNRKTKTFVYPPLVEVK